MRGLFFALFGHVVRIEHVYDKPPEERVIDGNKVTIIGPGQNLVRFEVVKSFRGTPGQQAIIHTSDQGSACGFAFEESHDYLVYASAGPSGELSTNHCTRTHQVLSVEDDQDIRWIESLAKSPPGGSIFGQTRTLRLNESRGYDAAALPRIAVSISGPEARTVSTAVSDGSFDFPGLAPGSYVIGANMDFAPRDGSPYYRKVSYPSTSNRAGAAITGLGSGQTIDKLKFFLPPDSPPPGIPLSVTVAGFDGKPASQFRMRRLSPQTICGITPLRRFPPLRTRTERQSLFCVPAPITMLKRSSTWPIFSQACAEPQALTAQVQSEPRLLKLSPSNG